MTRCARFSDSFSADIHYSFDGKLQPKQNKMWIRVGVRRPREDVLE